MVIGEKSISDFVEFKEGRLPNYKLFEKQLQEHERTEKQKLITLFFKKLASEWKESISSTDVQEEAVYNQTRKHLHPLKKQIKKGALSQQILDAVYLIVQYCMLREYVKAHDKYLGLAIGNAPWPMGVTSVGIHERPGRQRIET